MEVMVAKTAGFCFGVKRAVDQVKRQIAEGRKPIYTYGPIIHNEEVVRELAGQGVRVIERREGAAGYHGWNGRDPFPRRDQERIYREIKDQGLDMCGCDLSFCTKDSPNRPRVRRARAADVVIIGNDRTSGGGGYQGLV